MSSGARGSRAVYDMSIIEIVAGRGNNRSHIGGEMNGEWQTLFQGDADFDLLRDKVGGWFHAAALLSFLVLKG